MGCRRRWQAAGYSTTDDSDDTDFSSVLSVSSVVTDSCRELENGRRTDKGAGNGGNVSGFLVASGSAVPDLGR